LAKSWEGHGFLRRRKALSQAKLLLSPLKTIAQDLIGGREMTLGATMSFNGVKMGFKAGFSSFLLLGLAKGLNRLSSFGGRLLLMR
jgi:hypothetical protein